MIHRISTMAAAAALACVPFAAHAATGGPEILTGSAELSSAGRNACAPSPKAGAAFQGSLVRPAISGDGRMVAFRSNATVLPGVDADGIDQIYVTDRSTGLTRLVSGTADGRAGNGWSFSPSISKDGTVVGFSSCATDLAAPGSGAAPAASYVMEIATGRIELVSLSTGGAVANAGFDTAEPTAGETALSDDGRYVAFVSNATNLTDDGVPSDVQQVYLRDRVAGTTRLVSRGEVGVPGNADSDRPSISANGRVVAFESLSTNLTRRMDGNGTLAATGWNVFVRDLRAAATEQVDVTDVGSPSTALGNRPVVSANGRYVVFRSAAALSPADTNTTTDVYVRDRHTASNVIASLNEHGEQVAVPGAGYQGPSIDASGRLVAFYTTGRLVADDGNNHVDIYTRELTTGRTVLISRDSAGAAVATHTTSLRSFDPVLAADAGVVAFTSNMPLLGGPVDIVRQDTYVAPAR